MHSTTGEIRRFETVDEAIFNGFDVLIDDGDMTDKQKEAMQVSPYDNRSTLGKKYTQIRKERREQNENNLNPMKQKTRRDIDKAKAKRKAAKQARKINRRK